MKRLHITLFIAVICSTILAQENFTNGYIITNSNDTIYGKVDLRTSSINQKRCLFVSSETGEQMYYPGDIKGYRYTSAGKYYISKEITIDEKRHFIFTEYLVEGGLSLFYIKDGDRSYFLFEEGGKVPFYVTQNKPEEIGLSIKYDNKYKGILRYYFQDSSTTLLELIGKSKFNQKSMIAIVKQYNDENCLNPGQESCVIFENESPDKFFIKFKFSAYTGIQSTGFEDETYKINDKIFPLVGGQVFLYYPQWSKKFGLIANISLSKMSAESPQFGIPLTDNFYHIEYDIYTISYKVGAKYTYNKPKFKPSIEGGLSVTNILKNKSKYVHTEYGSKEYEIRKNHTGVYLGAGMEYNIRKEQSIFLHFNYDFYLKTDKAQKKSKGAIDIWQIKVGYTF